MAKVFRRQAGQDRREGDVLNLVMRLTENRYLHAIRHGFTLVMPIMIIGSLAILFNNFPLAQYQSLMERVWGGGWKSFGSMIYSGTFSIISLVVCLAISSQLAIWYRTNRNVNCKPLLPQIVSFSSVMITINFLDGEISLTEITGVNGLFLTILITIFATEIFLRLYSISRGRSKAVYTSEASDSVPAAMSAIWPALATLAVFTAIRLLFGLAGIPNINAGLNRLMQMPFESMSNTTFTAVFFSFASHFLWIFGIHGNNVLDNVAQKLYVTAMDENIAAAAAGAAAPNLFTKPFFDTFVFTGGSGATICLIIAIFLFGRRSGTRRLAKLSSPFALFNINEPLMYGLPIVLNPVYVLPFLITPIANTLTATLAMSVGMVPYTVRQVEWTTTIFANGYIVTGGSVAAIALQVFNLIMGVCIYAPFIRLADRLESRRFADTVARLGAYALEPGKHLVELPGDVGTVARLLGSDLSSHTDFSSGNEFHVYYQPIVDAGNGKVFAYETLLQWRHAVHGPVPTAVAIRLAEDSGAIDRLGLWVLDASLAQLAGFRSRGLDGLMQFSNVSVMQLEKPDFAPNVEKLLKKYGVPPEFLRLEVTEAAVLSMSPDVKDNMAQLESAGVRIAMDHFGLGRDTMECLRVLPPSTLKMDRSLIAGVSRPDGFSLKLVGDIAATCRDMGIDLIAEGVETREQLDALVGAGCRLIQGYYYSKPLDAAGLEEFARVMGK